LATKQEQVSVLTIDTKTRHVSAFICRYAEPHVLATRINLCIGNLLFKSKSFATLAARLSLNFTKGREDFCSRPSASLFSRHSPISRLTNSPSSLCSLRSFAAIHPRLFRASSCLFVAVNSAAVRLRASPPFPLFIFPSAPALPPVGSAI
jgi:hypothetical protein